jgi:hypothetical protein
MKWRRYRKISGRTINTVEIPFAVYRSLRSRIDPKVQQWHRGEEARDRLARVLSMAAEGNKQDYIAEILGVSQQYVSKALKNHKARQTKKDPK